MEEKRRKAPPIREDRGQRVAACQSGRETSSAASLGQHAPEVNRGRSADYPTCYHVGTCAGERVYWSPMMGLAVEKDGAFLVQLPASAVVEWQASDELLAALAANPDLYTALPAGLAEALEDNEGGVEASSDNLLRQPDARDGPLRGISRGVRLGGDDEAFAEQCARERDGLAAASNASLIRTELW